jgi:hypothetical protein
VALGKAPPDKPAFQPYWENPPYGMIGRIEETSASFEARSAPRSYPTIGDIRPRRSYRLDAMRTISKAGGCAKAFPMQRVPRPWNPEL